MRNIDEKLQQIQREQPARQEDLDKGRVRVERPERATASQTKRSA